MTRSTKGRYALRMIVDLAEHYDEGFITLKDVARRQGISKKYLEQIVSALNGSNLLLANRGYGGGYKLATTPDRITVGEILRRTEGSMAPVACVNGAPCERADKCATIYIWKGLDKVINGYLDSITIKDVIDVSR